MILISKECNRCSETKPVSEFTINRASKDGLYSLCKRCKAYSARKSREDNTIGVMLRGTKARAKKKRARV